MAGAEGKDKGGEEAPAAAAEEFVKTFVESVGKPEPEGDPNVSVSFALGWHMSDLYRATSWPGTKPGQNDGDLPGMSELSARERAKVGLDQIDVGLAHLSATIKAADLEVPSTDGSRKALEKGTEDDAEHKAFRSQIFALHLELLGKLTAVSFKIGKAYGLGRALADTTYEPTDIRTLQRELEEHRVANLLAWLSDLTSLFPAHAGHSVRDSLEKWRDWAKPPSLNLNKREPGEVVRLLRRQGQHWRALLSGEKRATDMLEQQDYIFAASKTLGQLEPSPGASH